MSDLLKRREVFADDPQRCVGFDDVTIRSDGSGRIVEAYTAVFNTRTEIRDADGHYNETIDPSAFNVTIAQRGTNFRVLYNHGRDLAGKPSFEGAMPVGRAVEVRPDERGVFTAVEYLDHPLGNAALAAVKSRAIGGYSFSGSFIKSQRTRAERGALPTIHRTEVAMREFGPVLYPAYAGAEILGTRSVQSFLSEFEAMDPDDRDELLRSLGVPTPPEPGDEITEDPTPVGQSARSRIARVSRGLVLIERK